jgi:phenylpropionate dioxygenase-like ring-hydroxylating dioxygenase large terminal subunit
MRVKTYPAREAHGYIYIWWGEAKPDYPALPWFDDLDASFSTVDLKDHWGVHYSRAIENQLDVFHLPFVHTTTIGRGGRTVTDGPLTVVNDNLMQIWVYSRADDGTSVSRRASELPLPQSEPFLKFMFPHHWMNRISDDVRITVFFTPIDQENCILYLRSYQRFMRLPIIRSIVTWFFNPSNRVILNQDKRVVLAQRPIKSALQMEEKLIPADRPIIEYRRVREELKRNAGHQDD